MKMRIKSLVPLLLLVLAGAAQGRDNEKRIFNGGPCAHDEFTFHVVLVGNGRVVCGGSPITQDWVLTAAHCNSSGLTAYLNYHPSHQPSVFAIAQTHIYIDGAQQRHDIMLLHLNRGTDRTVFPVAQLPPRHPDCRRPAVGAEIRWAAIVESTIVTQRPHQDARHGPAGGFEDINEVHNLLCGRVDVTACAGHPHYNPHAFPIPQPYFYDDAHVVCGQRGGVDGCRGNSGGGMLHNNILHGVLVYGNAGMVCGGPIGFMDICPYREWIHTRSGI
uniref:trypsin n=1 Tax=Esox lucius TaxID=8010 RepID=C1BZH5_ESOLU|nr:kallikrein-related peptidase 6 precursor [Esox lucius]ACO14428.1 Kallikrein-6 precursor [Esox lucius]